MTPYETQSIEIARSALAASQWADIIMVCALIAAGVAGIVAYLTLRIIIAQLKAAQWNALLSFEQDMASRRNKFSELAEDVKTSAQPDQTLQARYNEARENYFNSLDRLASSILNGQFPDREMKQDYQDTFKDVIRTFPDSFNTGTHFRKAVKLYNRWQDGK